MAGNGFARLQPVSSVPRSKALCAGCLALDRALRPMQSEQLKQDVEVSHTRMYASRLTTWNLVTKAKTWQLLPLPSPKQRRGLVPCKFLKRG